MSSSFKARVIAGCGLAAALASVQCAHAVNATDPPAPSPSSISPLAANPQLAQAAQLDSEVHAHIRAYQFAQAIPKAQQSLLLREAVLGPDHADVAASIETLAGLLNGTSRYAEAEPLYRRALAIRERILGPDHIDISYGLTNLALLLETTGRYSEAEALERRALVIREKVLRTYHPDVATALHNLALLLDETGRFSEADSLEERATEIMQALTPNAPASTNSPAGPSSPGRPNLPIEARDAGEPEPARISREALPEASNPQLAEATRLDGEVRAQHLAGEYAQAIPEAQRALQLREAVLGPDHLDVATNLDILAELLDRTGRSAEAEPLYRRAVAIRNGKLGADHVAWLRLDAERGYLEANANYRQAIVVAQKALEFSERAESQDHPDVARSLLNLATLYQAQAQYERAEPLLQRSLAINEKVFGPDGIFVAENLERLALLYQEQARYAEAEPLFTRSLAINELRFGPDNRLVPESLDSLAALYYMQGRYTLAEPLLRRSLAMREKTLVPNHPDIAQSLSNLASLYVTEGDYSQAESFFARSLVINQRLNGAHAPAVASNLFHLAVVYQQRGQDLQAQSLLERSLSIDEKAFGPDHPNVARGLVQLALGYQHQGEFAQAEPLLKRALAIDEKVLGPDHHDTAKVRESLGRNDAMQGDFADAVSNLRLSCSTQASRGPLGERAKDAAQAQRSHANDCWTLLSLALWGQSTQSDGAATTDRPETLKLEAFVATQRALQSAAGDAMARSAALRVANRAAVGPQAQAYEAVLLQRTNLDQRFAEAAGENGEKGAEKQRALAQARDEAASKIDRLSTELRSQAPRYWDYRSPEPVSVAALQTRTGADAVLLHEDEALIVFLIAPGNDRGLAIALNKEQIAWAQVGLTGDQVQALVVRLRQQIDPEGYDLRGFTLHEDLSPTFAARPRAFNRQAAYELYRALLGDDSIQAVIRDKPVLLFVPSGPLTSLPPALLVTAPPTGRDSDPAALRATAWLLRSKAVALLPAVSSLRILRQIRAANPLHTPDPLLVFANPEFHLVSSQPTARLRSAVVRDFRSYYRDGLPLAEALDSLPSLPGTKLEGEALERALGAGPASLLTGPHASKAALMARNDDGRLTKVRVLDFATHGLVAGDASELAEPALVLARGATPADELLMATEAATLRLNAEWVLLSACNTASPDAPEAEGLSGLSRAFFYAGARSLLVSHWRVRDDIAPRLVPAILLLERDNPTISRAQALRQASLDILDDRRLNAADPAAWAPFTLIGEASR
jgi:tetratricopeptide (TPR) repeat protein